MPEGLVHKSFSKEFCPRDDEKELFQARFPAVFSALEWVPKVFSEVGLYVVCVDSAALKKGEDISLGKVVALGW